ncbi:ABC transporter substrate-binding protein [Marinomonas sp. THO17]|uniref:ABC transporter substrate-binding protein n=1 Tax=Marinomonas sp. THO17 TaxID=3149048 RepID=UPI00336BC3AE
MKRLLIACLASVPMLVNAVTDITVQPVEERQLPAPKNLKSGPYDLPIITWGGDIATILANGNQAVTQPGSIFADAGLAFKLKRVDVFENQLRDYLEGNTPYLRGTMSMINMAASAVKGNDALTPTVFYQLTWSAGGDALVAKSNIQRPSDLCGKTIAMNYDGPHLNYANKVLTDAGCKLSDINFVFTKDLTGTRETPMEAFRAQNVDAAFVIIPDALAMTSGGGVGDGSETSIKGAKILLSTKTANRVIVDVYAVRSDYFERNKQEVEALAASLFKAQENLQSLASTKGSEYQALMRASAGILLDAPDAIADTEGLLLDAEISGFTQNVQFFQNANNFRNFENIVKESASGVIAMGIVSSAGPVAKADLNFALLASGVSTIQPEKPKFDQNEVTRVIENRQRQGGLDNATIFEFEVYFRPNQQVFDSSLYSAEFQKVFEMASTYGGAILTIEGHSDPLGYLRKKKEGEQPFVLNQIKTSARNLSLTRANQVKQAIIDFMSNEKGTVMDESQFGLIGHGIEMPNTGICGVDPCPPKTEQEWLSNMRVVFRILQVEAEESVFSPL